MQAPLALLGFLLGVWGFYQTGRVTLLLGGLFMLVNWPWTLLAVNNRLMAMEATQASAASRDLIVRWNALHFVRTLLGVLAVVSFLIGFLGH
jgi:hypothetical protein